MDYIHNSYRAKMSNGCGVGRERGGVGGWGWQTRNPSAYETKMVDEDVQSVCAGLVCGGEIMSWTV